MAIREVSVSGLEYLALVTSSCSALYGGSGGRIVGSRRPQL
jgi:hypothetical protein